MPDGLADLYVTLSLQNAQFMSGLEEAGAAGEDFTSGLLEGLQAVSDALAELTGDSERTAEGGEALGESFTGAADAAKELATSATEAGESLTDAGESIGDSAKVATDSVTGLADAAKAATDSADGLTTSATGLGDGLKGTGDSAAFLRDQLAGLADADKVLAESSAAVTDAIGLQARAMATLRDVTGSEAEVADATSAKVVAANDSAATSAAGAAGKYKLLGIALLAGAAISIHMAGTFQQSMTRLVTSAGESQKNLAMVSQGIEQMSVATNTSMSQLAAGMYYVESGGYHGAAGLTVLRAAAEGAQAEGAQLATVSNAVTSALNAYGLKASSAMAVTNELVTAVGRGKMTMQDLASSISTVLPVAAKMHISLAQVTGAIATMTSQGMSAQQSSLDLRHAIMSLANPTAVQSQEMGQLGINSVTLAKNMGRQGLTGTVQELEEAILKQMGPAGLVLLKAFNQSKLAAQSADTMIKAMPPSLAKLATAYQQGKISAEQWQQIIYKGSESAAAKNLLQQFSQTENAAHGFNEQLQAGGSDAQTFTAALSKAMGGITGAQVALMIGGAHAKTFDDNVKAIGASAANTGQNVENWALIQHNFNFQLGQAGKSVQAMAMSFGQVLLPAATAVMHAVAAFTSMIARNSIACKALAAVVGVLLAGALERGLVKGLKLGTDGIGDMISKGKNLIGFFRAGEDGVSGFSKSMTKIKSAGSSVWQGLQALWSKITGLFSTATTATDTQTAAQDANAAAAGVQATATESSTAATEANAAAKELQTTATEAQVAATEAATVAQEELDVAMDANPIGAIIALIVLVVGAIVLLVTRCKAFRDFWIDLWHDATRIIGDAVSWIKSHWELIVGILLGPIAIAAALILGHLHDIEQFFEDAWHDITSATDDFVSWIRSHLVLLGYIIATVLAGPLGTLVVLIVTHWDEIRHETASLCDDVVHFFEQLPSELYSIGKNIVEGLINGIESMAGSLLGACGHIASDIVGSIGRFLGISSPSRVMYWHGQMVVQGLVAGMDDGHGAVVAAAARLAAATQSPMLASRQIAALAMGGDGVYATPLAGGAAGAGGINVQVVINAPYGFVGSEQELATALYPVIQRAALDHGLYNGTTGLQKTG